MKNLGLKRYTVKLHPYQATWKSVFTETKEELLHLIGAYALDIQHIGSTSIPGLDSKPIIDIGIALENLSVIDKIVPILENNGYEYRGDCGSEGGHLFVKCSEPDVRTHHIHVVEKDDEQWNNYLYFRDKLNNNSDLASRYSELKRKLAAAYSENRFEYSKSKNQFIQEVLRKV